MPIRSVEVPDADAVRLLLRALGYSPTAQAVERNIARYRDSSDSVAIVETSEEGELLGMITGHLIPLMHEEGNLGRVTSLVVDASWRSNGTGARLMKEIEKYFVKNGCGRSEVTSGERRGGAHAFYEAVGYRISGKRMIKMLVN